ncbi:MAG TPA: YvrJ family protein [Ureibacillus sp.]|nr:YvrJ family protein [Ureibacillus sp.]
MDELFSYFDYGFSFLISIYLLIRMEKRIEGLTECINKLNNKLSESS